MNKQEQRETAHARVMAGATIQCKAYDFEEEKWYPCVLDKNEFDMVRATTPHDDLDWIPDEADLLDAQQFRF